MRRLVTRIVNRVLLSEQFAPVMGTEAEIHSQARRKLASGKKNPTSPATCHLMDCCLNLVTNVYFKVVGLGNPGMEATRHSVGMAVLGALAARLGVADRWRGDKHVSGEVIVSEVQHTHVVLLRPKLLMNINGVSVAKAAGKYGIKSEDILLVHDDLDKPLGKIAVKHGGSARGHNGVRSCVDCLQTDVMPRLRVGIGRPAGKTSVERHVLGRFTSEEQKILTSVLVQSVDLLLSQLSHQDSQSPTSPVGGRRAAQKRKERDCSAPPAQDSAAADG
ncbi:putative peptidyl-tRNA hydrolase [Channa argus]|uniref:peptidyl-tRNA hydrolase n=1 Tax=Channa argus TaxID=215402 RepID=A0A6G1PZH7_CHAAH|nr:putative peptidyl-tRNA hydrolase [Channa argus]